MGVNCQGCNKALNSGDKVVRLQYGTLYYVKHVGVKRKASTDDYFCDDCLKTGNVAVRGKTNQGKD